MPINYVLTFVELGVLPSPFFFAAADVEVSPLLALLPPLPPALRSPPPGTYNCHGVRTVKPVGTTASSDQAHP